MILDCFKTGLVIYKPSSKSKVCHPDLYEILIASVHIKKQLNFYSKFQKAI